MVCSLSVCGHHSYHLHPLTYVVLFRSFLLNPIHRCCQDFPLYLRAGAMPGLAQRSVRHGAGHRAWARGCEEQWGMSCQGAAVPGEALPGPQLPSVSIKAEILAELVCQPRSGPGKFLITRVLGEEPWDEGRYSYDIKTNK